MKYRNPIISRIPFIKRKSVHSRTPLIKRNPIITRHPISAEPVDYYGCELCNSTIGCNGVCYKSVETPNDIDESSFRLIYIKDMVYSDEYWNDIIKNITFVRSQNCNIRLITDSYVPDKVVFELSYSPYNVIQYNIDIIGKAVSQELKSSMVNAVNCGLYVTVMLYPILPGVTKTYDILEFLNSFHFNCRTVCFKFIEFSSELECVDGFYNINGYTVDSKYLVDDHGMMVCSQEFKDSFCTIMTQYLEPRKVNCSLCNDKICY